VKVAVYTIALNEAANAERWARSAADADYRIVADTGSTDGTREILEREGVVVHRIAIRPWRFDDARNAAMALIPDDVDVCCTMDMDRHLEPGWRARLEGAWRPETTALYNTVAYKNHPDAPNVLRSWPAKNFHARWGYRFRRPVHEALALTGKQELDASCGDIVMVEVQDHSKSTRRQYLPLMEVALREAPDDAQIAFWLGREYMWAGEHGRASELFLRYLGLPSSTWADERSEAMRYLARTEPDKKAHWLERARAEAPHRREIWLDLAEDLHSRGDWINLFWAAMNGLERTHRTGSYLDEPGVWGFRLLDLGAIAAWRLGLNAKAVELGRKALEMAPGDERLHNNLAFFESLPPGS
jgi:glycosyltransferase involved in cell wall biosynthesis